MSRAPQAPRRAAPAAPALPDDEARGTGLALNVLLIGAAAAALPDLWDVDVVKTAAVALLAAAVLLPWLALRGQRDVRAWLGCAGARLYLASVALGLPALLLAGAPVSDGAATSGADAGWGAALSDRLLGVALCTVAAVLGVRAARTATLGAAGADASAGSPVAAARALTVLATALLYATLLTAVVVLLQAVGVDERFTPPQADFYARELVGLLGNSTRAGALLALGLVAAFAIVTHEPLPERDSRVRLALATLSLASAALVLTRARGGWLGAALGLLAVGLAAPGPTLARARLWLVRLGIGLGLALVLAGGTDVFTRGKLPGSAPVLSGSDVTTSVRVAVWRGSLAMLAERPLLGHGLGRFRAEFPPFRDPLEAALPGLGGASTEVDHPHDEFLLAADEGGVLAGLCLLAFAAATLIVAWRLARGGDDRAPAARLALGVLVAGCALALVQNAWTSMGTALPVFAAAGVAWGLRRRADAAAADAAPAPGTLVTGATLAGLVLAMAGMLLLAIPRLDAHLALRAFYQRAHAGGIDADNIGLLVTAADAGPGDVDLQRLLLVFGGQLVELQPEAAAELDAPLARARARLAVLAPHAR